MRRRSPASVWKAGRNASPHSATMCASSIASRSSLPSAAAASSGRASTVHAASGDEMISHCAPSRNRSVSSVFFSSAQAAVIRERGVVLPGEFLDPPFEIQREGDGGHDQAGLPGLAGNRPAEDDVRLTRAGRQHADDGVSAAGRADRAHAGFLPGAQVSLPLRGLGVETVRAQLPVGPPGREVGRRLVWCCPLMLEPLGPPGLRLPLSVSGHETVIPPGVSRDRGQFRGFGDRGVAAAHERGPDQGQDLRRTRPRGRLQPPGQARRGLRQLRQGDRRSWPVHPGNEDGPAAVQAEYRMVQSVLDRGQDVIGG